MGSQLQAVVIPSHRMQPAPLWLHEAHIVALNQSFGMVPVTLRWVEEHFFDATEDDPFPDHDFRLLTAPLERVLKQYSQTGILAYIEADFFGGVGYQKAIVWENGAIILGPISSKGKSVISQALQRLGVYKGQFTDEFEALGLQRFRHIH